MRCMSLARTASRSAHRCMSSPAEGTPAGTRLAVFDSVYTRSNSNDTMDVEALRKSYRKPGPMAVSKVHSRRSLFDSAQTQQCADSKNFSDIARAPKTGTPDTTRLAVFDSDYGEEAPPADAGEKIRGLRGERRPASGGKVSAIHSRRALFDSVFVQGDDGKTFQDIVRSPKTGTPDATRLAVFDSDYGEDAQPADAGEKIKGLRGERRAAAGGKVSAIHSRRAMYDSVLAHGDDGKTLQDIVREPKTDTPDMTRLSMFDSDYGEQAPPADAGAKVKGLKGKRAPVVQVSKVHCSRRAFEGDV